MKDKEWWVEEFLNTVALDIGKAGKSKGISNVKKNIIIFIRKLLEEQREEIYKSLGVDLSDKREDIYTEFDGESITIKHDGSKHEEEA